MKSSRVKINGVTIRLIAVLALTTLTSHCLGQTDSTQQSAPAPFVRVGGYAGVTPLKKDPGNLIIHYVDESPSADNMSSEVPVKGSSLAFQMGFSIDAQFPAGGFARIGIEGALADVKEFEALFGVGYEHSWGDKFAVRILGKLSYGSAWLKLGDLYQNDVFIEVNNTRFYSESVNIDLSRRQLVGGPELELVFPLPNYKSTQIVLNAGYQFGLNISTPHLRFTGSDINNEEATASESITADNVLLILDQQIIRSNMIGVKGLSLRFGVAFSL